MICKYYQILNIEGRSLRLKCLRVGLSQRKAGICQGEEIVMPRWMLGYVKKTTRDEIEQLPFRLFEE